MPFGRRDGGLNPPSTRRKMNTNQPTNQPTNLPNADVILNCFKTLTLLATTTPLLQTGPLAALEELNWLKAKLLLRSVVKDNVGRELGALEQVIY